MGRSSRKCGVFGSEEFLDLSRSLSLNSVSEYLERRIQSQLLTVSVAMRLLTWSEFIAESDSAICARFKAVLRSEKERLLKSSCRTLSPLVVGVMEVAEAGETVLFVAAIAMEGRPLARRRRFADGNRTVELTPLAWASSALTLRWLLVHEYERAWASLPLNTINEIELQAFFGNAIDDACRIGLLIVALVIAGLIFNLNEAIVFETTTQTDVDNTSVLRTTDLVGTASGWLRLIRSRDLRVGLKVGQHTLDVIGTHPGVFGFTVVAITFRSSG